MRTLDILISGDGLAGPALAHWLRRDGHAVTVVERARGPRPGGYKVDLRGAAVTVADRMGVGERVRAEATGMRGGSWLTAAGKPVVTLGPDLVGFRDPGDLEILRGDLAAILRESSTGVEYVYGDAVTAITEDPRGVNVSFGHAPDRRFDLVVGADGLHSGVRGLVFGPEPDLVRPLGLSVAVFSAPNRLRLDRWENSCSATGRTAAVYGLRPDRPVTAQFFFPTPETPPARGDRAAQEHVVAEAFAGHGWEVPRLLAAMPESPDFYYDDLAQVRMDSWSRGRTVLLGDAGYCPSPASGQGTGLALVGAYVLASALAGHGVNGPHGTPAAAFAEYERIMRPYVDLNQKLGRDVVGKLVPHTRLGAAARRAMMRLLPYLPGKRMAMEAIMKPVREAANGVHLP